MRRLCIFLCLLSFDSFIEERTNSPEVGGNFRDEIPTLPIPDSKESANADAEGLKLKKNDFILFYILYH